VCDVPMLHTFGPDTLETFLVTVEEWKLRIGRRHMQFR
jgi:hypothetical protein